MRLSSVERMRRFLEDAQLRRWASVLTRATLILQADPHQEIRDGEAWIVATHLHDNHRMKDEHLLPFDGDIDWPKSLRLWRLFSTRAA